MIAKTVEKLFFNKGKLCTKFHLTILESTLMFGCMEFIDSRINFTVGFTKDSHLDLYWHSTGIPSQKLYRSIRTFTP